MLTFRSKLILLLGGMLVAAALAMLQLFLGSDPLIVMLVLGALAAVFLLVISRPFDFGTWYAAYFFLQLFGIAWFAKSALLLRFESGLIMPVESIAWSTLFVITACILAVAWQRFTPANPWIDRHYGDPASWTEAGLGLLILGEAAHLFAYLANVEETGTFGGFDPLKRFSLAATCLLASAAVQRGQLMTYPLAAALGAGVVDALLFSEKSELFLRVVAMGLIVATSPLSRRRKLLLGAMLPVVFLVLNTLIFPTIHATRDIRNRNLPMNERISLVKMMLGQSKDEKSYTKSSSGNIWMESVHFLPTDNWFLLRFGSVAYFDVTLKFGQPAAAATSLLEFAGSSLNEALPLGLLGEKENCSLADRLWWKLDARIKPGNYLTMGSYASARLLFGNVTGYLVTSTLILIIGLLVVRCYGNDVRSPLIMFIFVGIAYSLIDGDLDNLVSYIVRFFWQDVLVLVAAAWALRFWRQFKLASAEP